MQYEKTKKQCQYHENDEKMIKSETNHKRNNDDTITLISKDMKKDENSKQRQTLNERDTICRKARTR